MDDADPQQFRTRGYVVLRGALDAGVLSAEVDRALAEGLPAAFRSEVAGGISGRYLPLMTERTPVSLRLLARFAGVAETLLGRAVLPVRAKCVLYSGDAGWHHDSDVDIPSVGFAAYLEPLDASNGALRVRSGSHARTVDDGSGEIVLATRPGDVIAFDEHLWHASRGGRDRRQWRVDFVADPASDAEDAAIREYFAATYPPDWDGGYDVDRFPTYGPQWHASGRSWVARLRDLGVYDLATVQEDFTRSRR